MSGILEANLEVKWGLAAVLLLALSSPLAAQRPAPIPIQGPAPVKVLILTTGPPPTGVLVTGTPLVARLVWNAMPGASRYAVYRNEGPNPSIERTPAGFTATQLQDTLPDPRPTYRYTVVALYADGTRGEAPSVQYISPPMVNPAGFTAIHNGWGEVKFSWQPVPGAAQYRLDGPGMPNTGQHQTATTASIAGVPPGQGTWKVTALYPGNFAEYLTGTLVQAVVRVLPSRAMPFLSRNGVGTQAVADAHMNYECGYVMDCAANGSRSIRKDAYGLQFWGDPRRAPTEAVYGNATELGAGRRTDCGQGTSGRFATICYATSHGGFATTNGGWIMASALPRTAAGEAHDGYEYSLIPTPAWFDPWGFAPTGGTMITIDQAGMTFLAFTPGKNAPPNLLGNWDFAVRPVPTGAVSFDKEGPKFLPQSCIACHGGRYNPATQRVDGATLLPLDPGMLVFGGPPPGDRLSQEENTRKVNLVVINTTKSIAVINYINGLYNGAVAQPGARAVNDYVPVGWAQQAALYRSIVKPYCTMCHLAAPSNVSFSSWDNFQQNAALIHAAVCKNRTMPHAEIPFVQFWLKDTGTQFLPGQLAAALGYPSCS